MSKPKRYRLLITLDEEIYNQMRKMADLTGVGMATTARMILNLGFAVSQELKTADLASLQKATVPNEDDLDLDQMEG